MTCDISESDRANWTCALPLDFPTLFKEVKMGFDSGDAWGSIMGAFFPLASELYFRGEAIPDEWGYSPGAAGGDPREKEDYLFDVYRVADSAALQKLGDIFHRASDALKAKGLDY